MRPVVLSSRPIAWFGLAIVFLIGFSFGGGSFGSLAFIELLAFSIPFAFILFALNDVYDHASDAINARRRSVTNLLLAPKHHALALRLVRISLWVVLFIGSLVSLWLGFEHFLVVIITVALGYAYSAPPLRLKERPVFDSLSNGAIMVGLLLIGFTHGSPISEAPRQLLAIFFLGAGMHTLFAIADRDPDAHAQMKTIATVLGVRFASLFVLACGLLLVVWANFGSWFLIAAAHLIAASGLAVLLSGAPRVAKWSAQIISVYAVLAAPLYVIGLLF